MTSAYSLPSHLVQPAATVSLCVPAHLLTACGSIRCCARLSDNVHFKGYGLQEAANGWLEAVVASGVVPHAIADAAELQTPDYAITCQSTPSQFMLHRSEKEMNYLKGLSEGKETGLTTVWLALMITGWILTCASAILTYFVIRRSCVLKERAASGAPGKTSEQGPVTFSTLTSSSSTASKTHCPST